LGEVKQASSSRQAAAGKQQQASSSRQAAAGKQQQASSNRQAAAQAAALPKLPCLQKLVQVQCNRSSKQKKMGRSHQNCCESVTPEPKGDSIFFIRFKTNIWLHAR
jgi:hypothetical protein